MPIEAAIFFIVGSAIGGLVAGYFLGARRTPQIAPASYEDKIRQDQYRHFAAIYAREAAKLANAGASRASAGLADGGNPYAPSALGGLWTKPPDLV